VEAGRLLLPWHSLIELIEDVCELPSVSNGRFGFAAILRDAALRAAPQDEGRDCCDLALRSVAQRRVSKGGRASRRAGSGARVRLHRGERELASCTSARVLNLSK
jgi:hypothetical protein